MSLISLRLLFWNTRRTASLDHLKLLVQQTQADILVLAECQHSAVAIAANLNQPKRARYFAPVNLSERLKFIVALPPDRFVPLHDSAGVAVRRVYPPLGPDLLLVALHLPSKSYMTPADHAQISTRISRYVDEAEDKAGHGRTVVIGDFNMDPFEDGVVSSEGFHAVAARSVAARRTRTVLGTTRRFFYNPMWSLMGDHSLPVGTYYYSSSKMIAHFWHLYDQVLLRPELAMHFVPGDVFIVDSIGSSPLITPTGIIATEFSDHLPLAATIKMETADHG